MTYIHSHAHFQLINFFVRWLQARLVRKLERYVRNHDKAGRSSK
jgi:hypothetical protein